MLKKFIVIFICFLWGYIVVIHSGEWAELTRLKLKECTIFTLYILDILGFLEFNLTKILKKKTLKVYI